MLVSELANYGFNLSEAMELCADDEDIYKEVLETALEEGREKIPFINDLFAGKDFDRYIIEAHGLKNAARQIGCDKLSDMAKESELAGKAGDIDKMISNHEALMAEYQRVVDVMAQLF
ncbi:MAG: Hpt domain-containing protein [Lachnospiraceae bacterium]|jgi:HPt (histidine-containing phosphotransfer) domain-containing protein|nr:Hpt domain-containing protein [Lachnospiraceae bacterium]